MKKEKMKKSLRVTILMLLIASVSFVSCKDDKEEDKPVVPPTIEQLHTISGRVVDKDGKALSDVKVMLELKGEPATSFTTNAQGEFDFASIKKAGDYLLTTTKTNYHTTKVSLNIAKELKVSVMLFVPITMVNEGAKKEIVKADGGKIELGDKTGSIPNVEFVVPANALGKTETITITPVPDIMKMSSGTTPDKKELPLLTLECAPSGIEFAPCEIIVPNPLGEFTISNLKLMYHDGSNWAPESQGVITRDGNYVATITHFSTYQLAFDTKVASTTPSTEILSDVKGLDNLNGNKDIYVETIPYTFKSGYEYIVPVEQALATAGITGDNAAKMKPIIEESVKSKNNGMNVGYKTNTGNQGINQTIPVGVRLDVEGVQNFSTTNYVISFNKDGKEYPVTVSIKVAGNVSITTKTYNKQHQGGNAGL